MNFYVEDIVATTERILLNLIRGKYSKMFSQSEARAAIFVDESTRNLHTNKVCKPKCYTAWAEQQV